MIEVSEWKSFLHQFDSKGVPKQPFTVTSRMSIYLGHITSLDGVTFKERGLLSGLTTLTSLRSTVFEKQMKLRDLPEDFDIAASVNPSEAELAMMRALPIEKIDMIDWHSECGTAHCLYGSVQRKFGDMSLKPLDEGFRLLPSMMGVVYTETSTMRRYLESIQETA